MGLFDFLFEEKKLLNESYRTNDLILPKQIIQHLKLAVEENAQITIALKAKSERSYGSFMGEIREGGKTVIYIDAVVPEAGNDAIKKAKKLFISYFIDGVAYSFNSRYLGMVKMKFDYHKIEVPKRINKFQKRKTFRITASEANPFYVDFGKGKEEIFDISVGGLSLYSNANLFRLEKTKEEFQVKLIIPGANQEMKIKAVVRKAFAQTKTIDRTLKRKYALQFTEIKEADLSQISTYMMSRQREIAAHS